MPLYRYKCCKCEREFEELRKMSEADTEIDCPSCSSKDVKRKMPNSVSGSSSVSASHSPGCG